METLKEPISVRVARLNSELTGKTKTPERAPLISRETVLDALQVLYDECSAEGMQKLDSNIASFVLKYKSAIKNLKTLRVNISDFEIKNIIGCGHFGEVHVVKEKQTGDIYAMKTIRKFDNGTKRMSFEEERDIMAFGASPWLTSLQYSFQDSSYLFFVMDYHPGGDLLGLLYRVGGSLPESAAVFYLAELVLALHHLHGMGYVHRDVKPDNILLDRCGHLKLTDFGSAAKLGKDGLVKVGPPVGTPDYIAPEVLQCLDNKSEKTSGYGISCDFWSLGVLAYELTIGSPPFEGSTSTAIYSKIINHPKSLKFPADVCLSQAYVGFIKALITDAKSRLKPSKIQAHPVFTGTKFATLKDQVPPYVPKISSMEDTSNFVDVQAKKKHPSMEHFKKRSQFSGRNLPFVGFSFTHEEPAAFDQASKRRSIQETGLVDSLKAELASLKMTLAKSGDLVQEKDNVEKRLDETTIKLHSVEALRDSLEQQLAESLAESTAVKRRLELERRERMSLEKKALDLIKGAKLKWELAEKSKVEALDLEIRQLKSKIEQLSHTNQMLEEQLHHARKIEENTRQSAEAEQNITRRSVVGLENLLGKVNAEKQSLISQLQNKLTEEISHTSHLQNELLQQQEAMERKTLEMESVQAKLKRSKSQYVQLQNTLQDNEAVVKQLSRKVNELEKDSDKLDEYEMEIKSLRGKFDDSQKTLKNLQNKTSRLQSDCDAFEQLNSETVSLKLKMAQLQKRVADLEKQLEQKTEECRTLKKNADGADTGQAANQELREKQLQTYKMQKELSDCKIDKRILERELKEASAELKQLRETLTRSENQLLQSKKAQELALLELSEINENISMELMRSQDNVKMLQVKEKLQHEKSKTDEEKTIIAELKGFLKTKEDSNRQLANQIEALQSELSSANLRCNKEESEKTKLISLVEQLQKEKAHLGELLEKSASEQTAMKVNLEALREACTLLEGQVVEYEKLLALSKAKQSELSGNTEKLISDLCEARKDTQAAKRHINEEKSLRAVAEHRIKSLQEDLECMERECADYKNQCMEYKSYSATLSEELSGAEDKLSNTEVLVTSCERQVRKLTTENNQLKEEIAHHITEIGSLKESKYTLTHQAEDLNKNIAALAQRIRDLEVTLEEQMNYHKEREVKAEARDRQHLKLIDYLQSKIEELSHKKKSLTEVIFGSSKKENQPPISRALNYRDLEAQLTKEKETSKRLKEQVVKLKSATMCELSTNGKPGLKMEKSKSEILTPRTKAVLDQIATSPTQKRQVSQSSVRRMHHNIPHRFESKLNTMPQKCPQCHQPIPIGRNCSICKECKIAGHPACAPLLPKVCGLPKELANHYREIFENADPPGNGECGETVCEGWVKLPCKKLNSWEKRFARLTSSSLEIFTDAACAAPLKSFPLKPEGSHGKIILEPVPSEIGMPVANSDLPFIIKVEVSPETTCWPSDSLVLMALTAKDKDTWVSGLQRFFAPDPAASKLETLAKLPANLSVNCMVELTENIKVLGTDQGLFSYYNNSISALRIEGVANVEQISLFEDAVLMIHGAKLTLIGCDVNHLINLTQCAPCAKPTLNYHNINVNNLSGFHLLQVSKHASQKKIAVATAKQLLILEYYYESKEFVPVRILDTAQPTSCMLFTEHSLIVGADKFFEIDLSLFQAEEFLDASDLNLKPALKCHKLGSFPVGIVEVSQNPREYLLTFNEFSIFVDEYGRSSREKEIKNQHLPLAVHLIKNYLYVVQFAAVEILKISEELCSLMAGDSYRLGLTKFKLLGANAKGIFIEHDAHVKFLNARHLPDYDAVSIGSETTDNSRFSFTSSMVQSLDGNGSDSADLDHAPRVKFQQTDL
ncbi:citron Rho-interacting kinase isoform X1 [Dendroctonus ponderosae]|nr:citron Rho-interacting kinase isoform X1 [Dendroctonus ponderosae]XP_048521763.1 citron Rho-interacting kinase isoform X1 [Dendroctonus ponderosae]